MGVEMSGEGRKAERFILPKLGNTKTSWAAWAAQADPELPNMVSRAIGAAAQISRLGSPLTTARLAGYQPGAEPVATLARSIR